MTEGEAQCLLEPWLSRFDLSEPYLAAETGIAWVWRVQRGGGDAALKVYKGGDTRDEGPGVDFLAAAGTRAVRVLDRGAGAVLMEWLDGPTLGDVLRRGDLTRADADLAEVARGLGPVAEAPGFARPERWMADLLAAAPDGPFGGPRSVARALLAEAEILRVLHGDLHHDNVAEGPRGWCAIDAKGVIGDPAYELANGFRNPVGAEDVWRDPGRIRARCALWSDMLGVPPTRMMGWAVVHLALSILWDKGGADHVDFDMIAVFEAILQES